MKSAFSGWFSQVTIIVITQAVVDGFTIDTETATSFKGTIQPLSPNQLMFKPEGQREFEWLQIHCIAGELNLSPNDRITYNDKNFKIMAQKDYSLNNYIEYHAIADFTVPA